FTALFPSASIPLRRLWKPSLSPSHIQYMPVELAGVLLAEPLHSGRSRACEVVAKLLQGILPRLRSSGWYIVAFSHPPSPSISYICMPMFASSVANYSPARCLRIR
ncbi:unnamed protein product, partial [Laminaria digitata]